jgi:hypothetical protein
MASKFILVATLAAAAALGWQSVSAQASSPVSRDQRKAETAAANKGGQLTPAGEGSAPVAKSTTKSTRTRAERKAETLEARKAGTLAPPGSTQKADNAERAKPTTRSRAERKAETVEAAKKRELVPAGQGSPAPSK